MTQKEVQEFLLELSKEKDPIEEIHICMTNIYTIQIVKFNILLSLLLFSAFWLGVFSYGALIGIAIISLTLFFRINDKQSKYLPQMKKICKKLKFHIMRDKGNELQEIFKYSGFKFVIENIINDKSNELSNSAKIIIDKNKEELSHSEIKLFLNSYKGKEKDIAYNNVNRYFEENKNELLAKSYKEF